MNREIKFRAWDKEKSRWVNLNSIINNWGGTDYVNAMSIVGDAKLELNDGYGRLIWLQYTGLKDKNGREIYEGDIISSYPTWDWVVIWSRKSHSYACRSTHRSREKNRHLYMRILIAAKNGTIVGNIYENPELLEKGGTE